jgi:hypothetical protein
LYPVFRTFFFLPCKEKIYQSAQNLIAVANWMHSQNDHKFDHIVRNIQNACDNLGLYTAPGDRIPEDLFPQVNVIWVNRAVNTDAAR